MLNFPGISIGNFIKQGLFHGHVVSVARRQEGTLAQRCAAEVRITESHHPFHTLDVPYICSFSKPPRHPSRRGVKADSECRHARAGRFRDCGFGSVHLRRQMSEGCSAEFSPLLGAYLIHRGVTGRCEGYRRLGIDTAGNNDRRGVPEDVGVKVDKSVEVRRSPMELYHFWHQLTNLPEIMPHVVSVTVAGLPLALGRRRACRKAGGMGRRIHQRKTRRTHRLAITARLGCPKRRVGSFRSHR